MEETKLVNLSDILEIQNKSMENIEDQQTYESIINKMEDSSDKIVVRDIFYNKYIEIDEPHLIYDSSIGLLVGIGEKEDVIGYYKSHVGGIKDYLIKIKDKDKEGKGKKAIEEIVNYTKVWKIEKNQNFIDKICNITGYLKGGIKDNEKGLMKMLDIKID
ncbi:hypothetical protein [Romboutsia sp.]|uniref:hypothetical protein n=1 Tax=Romboutsia sp. TaxID=1965302 RepID=UPI003F3B8A1F